MTPDQEEFLDRLMANAKAANTSPEFIKPTVELVRSHGGIVVDLRRQISDLKAEVDSLKRSNGGTTDSVARSAIQSLREHLRRA